jgi:hypothetical protein
MAKLTLRYSTGDAATDAHLRDILARYEACAGYFRHP